MKLRCGILLCSLLCLLLLSSSLAHRRKDNRNKGTKPKGRTQTRGQNWRVELKKSGRPRGLTFEISLGVERRDSNPRNANGLLNQDTQYVFTWPPNFWFTRPNRDSNKKNIALPYSGEWIRLRRAQKFLSSGVVQVYRSGKWGYVCDDNWEIEDASVACRQLGYTRGAAAAGGFTEYLPNQEWEKAEILMDEVHCTGTEKALHLCNYNTEHDCGPTEAATVVCLPNEGCPNGWIAGFGKCYNFFTDAKNIGSAQKFCAEKNGSLLTIESASENHFLSNILKNLKSTTETHQWYTGGMTVKQIWKWSKSVQLPTTKNLNSKPIYRTVRSTIADPVSWFPGWPSVSPSLAEPKADPNYKCLTLSDVFESPSNTREIVDYYFWKADVCQKENGISFICQMENKIIPTEDCYNSNGIDYRGFATITDKGSQCLNWLDSTKVNDRTHPDQGLGDHNYCRNPDVDARPWCWTNHELLQFGFCKIARCSDVIELTESSSSPAEEMNCPAEEFYCVKDSECIPKAFRCDKDVDCVSGEDEENCEYSVDKFEVTKNATLQLTNRTLTFSFASYINFTEEKCAKKCVENAENICRSFVYDSQSHKCDLSKFNSLHGSIVPTALHHLYELSSQKNCAGKFKCANSFCVDSSLRCDGKDDCNDFSDELGCNNEDKIEVTLVDGDENSGTVEITYMGEKGLICDDDWSIEDAHVICRMLGYGKAEKHTILNYFDHPTYKVVFMLDNVKCYGNESSIKDCPRSNWKQHDCSVYEIAGAVCKSSKVCTSEQFTCKKGDCLKAEYVCDKINQCGDNSDEKNCTSIEFKLVNGNRPHEGRVEVIRNGLQGTVCNDGWDENEVAVICRSLGFRYGGEIAKNGKFGQGTGPIWLDNLQCNGTESSLSECQHDRWGVGDCDHSEDVAVVCYTRQQATVRPTTISSILTTKRRIYRPIRPTGRPSSVTSGNSSIMISLEGGSGPHEGVVVVSIKGRKYYICDDEWDDVDASVVCRTLTLSEDGMATHGSKFGDTTSTNYILDDVKCTGSEASLTQCVANIGVYKHDCIAREQAGVMCKNNAISTNEPSNIIPTRDPIEKAGQCGYRPFDHKDLLNIRDRRSIEDSDLHAPRKLDKHNVEKIIGGNFARHGEYPWQVRVNRFLSSRTSTHHCGAVIISEYWLLSAAHCFTDYRKSAFQMIVGDHHMKSKDTGEQTFNVEHIIVHERYIKPDYDIALIKIKPVNGRGIVFNDFVQPACLPDGNSDYSKYLDCSISGWGRSAQAPVYPDVLKGIKIPVIDQSVCSTLYNSNYFQRSFTDRMMCAGYVEGGIDTCDGDSGGPLVCKEKGSYTVMGLTSWGRGCAQPRAPGVYSKVKVFLSWISATINTYSSNDAEKMIPSRT